MQLHAPKVLYYTKVPKNMYWEKANLFTKLCQETEQLHAEEGNQICISHLAKNKVKYGSKFEYKIKNMRLVEENMNSVKFSWILTNSPTLYNFAFSLLHERVHIPHSLTKHKKI